MPNTKTVKMTLEITDDDGRVDVLTFYKVALAHDLDSVLSITIKAATPPTQLFTSSTKKPLRLPPQRLLLNLSGILQPDEDGVTHQIQKGAHSA